MAGWGEVPVPFDIGTLLKKTVSLQFGVLTLFFMVAVLLLRGHQSKDGSPIADVASKSVYRIRNASARRQ